MIPKNVIKSSINFHKREIRRLEKLLSLPSKYFKKQCSWCKRIFDNPKSLTNHERNHPEYEERIKMIRKNLVNNIKEVNKKERKDGRK